MLLPMALPCGWWASPTNIVSKFLLCRVICPYGHMSWWMRHSSLSLFLPSPALTLPFFSVSISRPTRMDAICFLKLLSAIRTSIGLLGTKLALLLCLQASCNCFGEYLNDFFLKLQWNNILCLSKSLLQNMPCLFYLCVLTVMPLCDLLVWWGLHLVSYNILLGYLPRIGVNPAFPGQAWR